MAKGKLPSITSTIPNDLRRFLDRVREFIDSSDVSPTVLSGRTSTVGTKIVSAANTAPKYTVTPANFTATGQPGAVTLTWDTPADSAYAYTEIWSSSTDDRTTALRVATSTPSEYVHDTPTAGTYYYWIRFINLDGVAGAFNSISGTVATSTSAGLKSALIFLYQASSSGTVAPSDPTATLTYTFATNALTTTGINGWSQTAPSLSVGQYLWMISAFPTSTTDTADIEVADWTTAAVLSYSPEDGTDGQDGSSGSPGDHGAGLYFVDYGSSTLPTESTGQTTIDSAYTNESGFSSPVEGDVIVFRNDTPSSQAFRYNDSTNDWEEQAAFIDGDAIVTGTLSVGALRSGNLDGDSSYSFNIGTGTSVSGIDGIAAFESSGAKVPLLAASSSSGVAAFLAGSVNSTAGGFWNSTSSSYTTHNAYAEFATSSTYTSGSNSYPVTIQTGSSSTNYTAWKDGSNAVMYGGRSAGARTIITYANPSITSAPVLTNYGNTSSADTSLAFDTGFYYNYSTNTVHFPNSASPFTGSHEALIATGTLIEVGDICVDVEVIERDGVSNVLTRVEKSSAANQAAAIGVFVTTADIIPEVLRVVTQTEHVDAPFSEVEDDVVISIKEGFEQAMTDNDVCLVNALGEGQVNVCGENGDIAIGDLIVTSNTAGKGMKQADDIIRSYTVAKAREAVTFANATDTAQIACVYLCG